LIIAGSNDALESFRKTTATMLVDSIDECKDFILKNESEILIDIQQVPTGFNMTAKHKDGNIFEYIEHSKL
jgi:hypothetical protein